MRSRRSCSDVMMTWLFSREGQIAKTSASAWCTGTPKPWTTGSSTSTARTRSSTSTADESTRERHTGTSTSSSRRECNPSGRSVTHCRGAPPLPRFGSNHLGSGRQWVSWVDLDDLVAAMIRAIDDPTMTGTSHVTSPNPGLMATYRRQAESRSRAGPRSVGWHAQPGWSRSTANAPPARAHDATQHGGRRRSRRPRSRRA
jgi:hypothetical protein